MAVPICISELHPFASEKALCLKQTKKVLLPAKSEATLNLPYVYKEPKYWSQKADFDIIKVWFLSPFFFRKNIIEWLKTHETFLKLRSWMIDLINLPVIKCRLLFDPLGTSHVTLTCCVKVCSLVCVPPQDTGTAWRSTHAWSPGTRTTERSTELCLPCIRTFSH